MADSWTAVPRHYSGFLARQGRRRHNSDIQQAQVLWSVARTPGTIRTGVPPVEETIRASRLKSPLRKWDCDPRTLLEPFQL